MSTGRRRRRVYQRRLIVFALFIVLLGFIWKGSTRREQPEKKNNETQTAMMNISKHLSLQAVTTNHSSKVAVVSAFRDPRTPDVILIQLIGGPYTVKQSFFCHFRGKQGFLYTVNADLFKSMDEVSYKHYGYFFHCPLWYPDSKEKIKYVSVSETYVDIESSGVTVIDIPPNQPKTVSIAACVSPLFGDNYDENHLTTWIEMNRLLGISHFIFYNYSSPSRLHSIFDDYQSQGLVSLLQWQVDPTSIYYSNNETVHIKKMRNFGRIEAYNDCLYRLTNHHRYVMFITLDEIIIPYRHWRVDEVLASLDAPANTYNTFSFEAVFLPGDLDEESINDDPNSIFLRHSKVYVFEPAILRLSKFIVKSYQTLEITTFKIIDFSGNEMMPFRVDPSLARNLRYQQIPQEMENTYMVVRSDYRMRDYLKQLLEGLERVHRRRLDAVSVAKAK